MANQLLLPNIVGEFNQGYDRGRELSLNDLAAKAYGAPAGQQRDALVGQAIGVDRNSGMQLGNDLQSMQDARDAKLGAAARYVLNAYQTGNPAATEGAYQAVKPFLQSLHSSMGATTPTPDNFSPDMLPAIYQIVARTQGAVNMKTPAAIQTMQYLGQGMTPAEQEQMRRVKAGLDPRASNPNYSKIEVPDGQGGKILAFFNTRTKQVELPDYGNIQGAAPTTAESPEDINARISSAVNSGQMTPEQGDAAIAQAYRGAGYSVGGGAPTSGGLGYTPAKSLSEKAPSGYQYTPDGSRLEPIPGGPADKGGASSQIGDQTKTGQDFLQSISDPGMQHMIQAIADGRMAVPKIYRPSKGGEVGATEIAQAVNSYDPSFDAVNYNARQGTLKGFTSGKEAQTINALNTVAEHLGTLSDAADELNNSNYQFMNRIGNAYLRETGDPRIARFDTVRKAAADEIAKVWRASGGSQADIEENLKNLDGAQSPAQLHAAIGTLVQLIGGKLSALQDQYNSGMGIAANRHSIVSPAAMSSFQRVLTRAGMTAPEVTGNSIQSQPSGQAAPQTDYSHLWGG